MFGGSNEFSCRISLDVKGLTQFSVYLAESREDGPHVATKFHGDDACVVLLVHPDEEVFPVVVPNAAAIVPVPRHAGRCQQRRYRLVKQKMILKRETRMFKYQQEIIG